MLLCLIVKGYTPTESGAGNSTFLDVILGVGGFVDPLDEEAVVAHLHAHFYGCAWGYNQPQGYDTYDLTGVMIMGKNVMDSDDLITEAQAKTIIAQHGCASSGRILISTFGRLREQYVVWKDLFMEEQPPRGLDGPVPHPIKQGAKAAIVAAAHPLPEDEPT